MPQNTTIIVQLLLKPKFTSGFKKLDWGSRSRAAQGLGSLSKKKAME
jgi:hypothetical protein